MSGNLVDTFVYQCELYFGAVGLTDEYQKVAFATLLLVDDAATWL